MQAWNYWIRALLPLLFWTAFSKTESALEAMLVCEILFTDWLGRQAIFGEADIIQRCSNILKRAVHLRIRMKFLKSKAKSSIFICVYGRGHMLRIRRMFTVRTPDACDSVWALLVYDHRLPEFNLLQPVLLHNRRLIIRFSLYFEVVFLKMNCGTSSLLQSCITLGALWQNFGTFFGLYWCFWITICGVLVRQRVLLL